MIPIPSPLVEFILLGPLEDRRQLQDSPILGDVWMAYAETPAAPMDLLITPYKTGGTIGEGDRRHVCGHPPSASRQGSAGHALPHPALSGGAVDASPASPPT